MKCKCRSESEGHDHKAGECPNEVVDGLVCPKCQALDTLGLGWEVHVEGPDNQTALDALVAAGRHGEHPKPPDR
jgi:hypothetical protein